VIAVRCIGVRKRVLPSILLGSAVAAACIGCFLLRERDPFSWMSLLEYKLYDQQMNWVLAPSNGASSVVFADISQTGIDEYHRETEGEVSWPWQRQLYGDLLIASAKARVVAFDLLFEGRSARGPEDDRAFAAALKGHGRAVLASMHRDDIPSPGSEEKLAAHSIRVYGTEYLDKTERAESLPPPISPIAEACAGVGYVNIPLDRDGTVRRYPTVARIGERYLPSLGLRALMLSEGVRQVTIHPGRIMQVGQYKFPVDSAGNLVLHYYGGRYTLPKLSAKTMIHSGYVISQERGRTPPVLPEDLADKFVIVGTTAPGLMDHFVTPTDDLFFGPEIHATAIANMLSYGAVRPSDALLTAGSIVLFSWAGALLFLRRRVLFSVPCLVGLVAALGGLSFRALKCDYWLETWPPLMALLITYSASQVYNYLTEGRTRRKIENTFKKYVAPKVVEALIDDPSLVDSLGRRMRLTIMFLDFEGFTRLSERMDPHALLELLNEYHRAGVAEIFDTGGTLDKYMGDGIMAYWGAPQGVEDQAFRACQAALAIQKRLRALQRDAESLKARIGINTGECIWGNVGRGDHQNISIIGDEVNLTSRLEGANKAFGTHIMISESTLRECGDRLVAREIGPIRVVGKQRAIRTYELLGMKTEIASGLSDAFREGWERFYARDFAAAEEIFRRFDDRLSRICADRCRELREKPPPESWEFVIDLENK
jgi:adenylate cyclase